MKRPPTIPQPYPYRYGVFKTWPVYYWRPCICCDNEFRRERGWRFLGGPFHGGHGTWRYLCNTCAPDKYEAHRLANEHAAGLPKPTN